MQKTIKAYFLQNCKIFFDTKIIGIYIARILPKILLDKQSKAFFLTVSVPVNNNRLYYTLLGMNINTIYILAMTWWVLFVQVSISRLFSFDFIL
jgi:hypothetical protein